MKLQRVYGDPTQLLRDGEEAHEVPFRVGLDTYTHPGNFCTDPRLIGKLSREAWLRRYRQCSPVAVLQPSNRLVCRCWHCDGLFVEIPSTMEETEA